MFLASRLQNHIRFETVPSRVVIFRLDDGNPYDSGLCGMFARTRCTLAGSSEHTFPNTDTVSTDRLGSLTRSHVRDIDDASIIRAMVAMSSENARDAVEDALSCLER